MALLLGPEDRNICSKTAQKIFLQLRRSDIFRAWPIRTHKFISTSFLRLKADKASLRPNATTKNLAWNTTSGISSNSLAIDEQNIPLLRSLETFLINLVLQRSRSSGPKRSVVQTLSAQ